MNFGSHCVPLYLIHFEKKYFQFLDMLVYLHIQNWGKEEQGQRPALSHERGHGDISM